MVMVKSEASTLTEAVAVLPVPPFVALTAPVKLTWVPAVTAVTLTANVQLLLVAIVPPVRLTLPDPGAAVTVPAPHVPVRPFGVDTVSPRGRVSVKATPARAMDALELVMVKLRVVVAPRPSVAAPNDLAIEGGVPTASVADAVLPVPPLVEVTAPVVLLSIPGAALVTFTLTTQFKVAGIVPPVRLMLPEPAVAVTAPPLHEPARPFGVATVMPAGKVSVKATPERATAFVAGLVIVKDNVDVPFGTIVAGVNALEIEGGATMLTEADAVPPTPPCADVTFPVVLFCVPATVPVTFTLKVQEALAAIVAPDKLTMFVPCVAVIPPPPQLPVRPFGVATTKPAGKVSAKPTPLTPLAGLLF